MTLPPPLRFTYYLIWLIRKMLNRDEGTLKTSKEETTQYCELLLHLVRTKKQIDEDAKISDKFSDLKMDISNMLEEKIANLKGELLTLKK